MSNWGFTAFSYLDYFLSTEVASAAEEGRILFNSNTASTKPSTSVEGGNKAAQHYSLWRGVAGFCTFWAIHHSWEGEHEHQSDYPIRLASKNSHLARPQEACLGPLLFREEPERLPSLPLAPQTCLLVCVGKELVACRSIKGKEEFMAALGKHFSTVSWHLKVRRLTFKQA